MKLLDLFCGAGGAAMGYYHAGFTDITGVDIKPQRHYPFKFIQADAMTFPLEGYDVIHASPPCQGESIMRNLPWLKHKDYPMLIIPTRKRLQQTSALWIIENVEHARRSRLKPHGMQAGYLCGRMFGLPFYRHRLFETNFAWFQPGHSKHVAKIREGRFLGSRARSIVFSEAEDSRGLLSWPGRRDKAGSGLTLVQKPGGQASWFSRLDARGEYAGIGHTKGAAAAREAMGMAWMTGKELSQAIPPIYTEFIGRQLMAQLRQRADAPMLAGESSKGVETK